MDSETKRQLSELRKDRAKVIAGLRGQLNTMRSLEDVKLLLKALVSLQESQDLLDSWERTQ